MESDGEAEACTTLVAKATNGGLSQQLDRNRGAPLAQDGRSGRLRHISSQDLQYRHEPKWDRNHQEPKGAWKPRAASKVTVEDATHPERSQSRADKGQPQRGGTEGDFLSSRQGLHQDVAGDTELKATVEESGKKKGPADKKRAELRQKERGLCADAPCGKPPTLAAKAEEKLGNSSSGTTHPASDRPCQSGNNWGRGIDPCGEHPTAATIVEEVGSTSHPQARQPQCRRKSISGDGDRHPTAAVTAEELGDTSHPQARQAQCRKNLVTGDGDAPCRKHPAAATAPEDGFGKTSHPQARQSHHRKKVVSGDGGVPCDNHPTAKAAEEELDKTTIPQVRKDQSGNTLVSEDGDFPCDNHPTATTTEDELDKTTYRQSRKHQSGKKSVSGNGSVPCDKHLNISGDGDDPCDKHPEAPTAKEELYTAHPKCRKHHSWKKLIPGDEDVPFDTHPKATTAEEDFGDITHPLAKGPRHMKKLVCGDGHVPFDTHPEATSAAELGCSSSWSTDRPFQSGRNAACGDVPTPLGKQLEAEAEEFVPQANTTVESKADAEASQPLATDRTRNWPPPRKAYGDRLTAAMETYFSSARYLREVIDSWDISEILVVREAVYMLQEDCHLLSSFLKYRVSRLDKLLGWRWSDYYRRYQHQEVPLSGTDEASAWMRRERRRLEEAVAGLQTEIEASARLQEVRAERDKALAEAQEARARAKEVEAERDQALAEAKAGLKAWETEKVKMRFEARTALNNAQAAAQKERIAAAKVKSDLEAKLKREEEARQRHEELFCKICFSAPRNVVLLPCFHGHYCSGCIETHRRDNPTCPVCRTYITGTVPYTA